MSSLCERQNNKAAIWIYIGANEQLTIPVDGTYSSMTSMGGRRMFAPNFEENARVLNDFLYEK